MSKYRFDKDTAGVALGSGMVAVTLHPEWNVDGRILNGGYLQAVIVRAAQQVLAGAAVAGAAGAQVPVAVSTSFAAAAVPGPAMVTMRTLRAGSRVTAVHADLGQDGATVVSSLITFGAASGFASLASTADAGPLAAARRGERTDPTCPAMPLVTGAAESIRVPEQQLPGPPGLVRLMDYAFVPESSRWLTGDNSAGPRIRCWLAFADGRPIDTLAAVALVDIAPPVCFALGNFGWAPTLQLQVGLFAAPTPGPVLLDLVGSPYGAGVVAEDGLLWDSAGTLIARSRQIALAPRTAR